MPEPEEERPLAGRHERPSCYQPTARDRALWAEWEASFADTPNTENWGGADDHELTSAEWLEAAKRQMEEEEEDPEFAAFMRRIHQSPAFLPAHPQE